MQAVRIKIHSQTCSGWGQINKEKLGGYTVDSLYHTAKFMRVRACWAGGAQKHLNTTAPPSCYFRQPPASCARMQHLTVPTDQLQLG